MAANDNVSLNVLRVMEKNAQQLKDFLANEVTVMNREAQHRAHIATLGDRPCVGCNPCQPEALE